MAMRPVRTTVRVGRIAFDCAIGNITASRAEAIVSYEDDDLSVGGVVSRAIGMAGFWRDICEHVGRACASRQPLVGDVVVTSAPGVTARSIFHAVTVACASEGGLSYRRRHGHAN